VEKIKPEEPDLHKVIRETKGVEIGEAKEGF
jgi:hypothetical protein